MTEHSAKQLNADTIEHYTKERLEQLSISHGLDGGGYEYEEPDESMPELTEIGAVVWEDPDFDYLTGDHPAPKYRGASLLWAFEPGAIGDTEWPATLAAPWDEKIQVLVATGTFNEYDRECDCRGESDADESGGWKYTGNASDDPNPDCMKCDGDGTIVHEGGAWAVYATIDGPISFYDPADHTSEARRRRTVDRVRDAYDRAHRYHWSHAELLIELIRTVEDPGVLSDYDEGYLAAVRDTEYSRIMRAVTWAHRLDGRVYFDYTTYSEALRARPSESPHEDGRIESAHVWRLDAKNGDPASAVKAWSEWRR